MAKAILALRWPDTSKLSKGAFGIVKKLRKAGFEAYLAGGAVRDALLKRPIAEIDIATSAKPDEVKKLFKKTIPTGEKHGTVTVFHPLSISPYLPSGDRGRKKKEISPPPGRKGERKRGWGYEVTTFRSEGPYLDHRRPSRVKFLKTAEQDANRRDLTVNALFYDPDRKQVIDYVNGIADLSHRKVRFIGESEDRIKEDALRLLRAVRFSATLGFGLARDTQKAVTRYAKLINKISAERVKLELDRIILSPRAAIGIGLLDIVGLLSEILPELKACQGVVQPKNQHSEGDVYAHSLLALEKVEENYDLPTRYAVLFHDLGKPQTRRIRDGKITFYDHNNLGAELAKKIAKRLKFSHAETEKIAWLIKNHLVPNDFGAMRLGTRRKWALNPYFPALLKVYRADVLASIPAGKNREPDLSAYHLGLKLLQDVQTKPLLKKPLLSGHQVMKILKIKPGPMVGKILRLIEDQKLAGKIKNKLAARKFLKNFAKKLDKKLSTL